MTGRLPGIDYLCLENVCNSNDIDAVYYVLDDMLLDGKLDEVDTLLRKIDVQQIAVRIMLSYLTVTRPWKHELKCRSGLCERIRTALASKNKIELLSGLE